MLQATVSLDGAILEPTREIYEDRIEIVSWATGAGESFRVLLATETDDPEAFADCLAWDETVREHRRFDAVAGEHRFLVEYDPDLPDIEAHGSLVANDGVPHRCHTVDGGDWTVDLAVADREALHAFTDESAAVGLPVEVRRLQSSDESGDRPYGLTRPQWEALRVALDAGYYEYPQRATQAEVADRLGISRQATAERLHRGLSRLLTWTLDGSGSDGSSHR